MELMRESWTDERLDDLNNRVSDGFRQVDARFERIEGEIKDLRKEMNARFDSMQRSMMQAVVALSAGMLAGFGGLIAQL